MLLGELLVAQGLASNAEIKTALACQELFGGRIGEHLIALGIITKETLQSALRQTNRKHDVVAVQIADRYEMELPSLGRLVLEDAESGEILEIHTGSASSRDAFALRQEKQIQELAKQFRSSGIDSIQVRTDEPYGAALGRFFETREKRRLRR